MTAGPRLAAAAAAALLLIAVGARIVTDRPGLEAQYFALSNDWRGEPVFTQVRPPRLERAEDAVRIFHSLEAFSIRWRGWLSIDRQPQPPLRFSLVADEAAYLRLDGDLVVDRTGVFGPPRPDGVVELAPGLHRLEIGMAHGDGSAFLQVLTAAGGATGDPETELEPDRLWASRPGPARRMARRFLSGRSLLERRLVGGVLLVAGLLLLLRASDGGAALAGRWRRATTRLAARLGGRRRLRLAAALAVLTVLAVVVYRVMLRLTGSPLGFDDVRYLATAFRTQAHGWMVDRYVHIYLMKAWQAFFPGDVFLAARHY